MRKSDQDLQKVTLNLYKGDFEKLQSYYPDIGASAIIRRLIQSFLTRIETTGEKNIDASVEVKI